MNVDNKCILILALAIALLPIEITDISYHSRAVADTLKYNFAHYYCEFVTTIRSVPRSCY